MAKQAVVQKQALVQPEKVDRRVTAQTRKEATERVEGLKLKLLLMVDRNFDQSLVIIRRWLHDDKKA